MLKAAFKMMNLVSNSKQTPAVHELPAGILRNHARLLASTSDLCLRLPNRRHVLSRSTFCNKQLHLVWLASSFPSLRFLKQHTCADLPIEEPSSAGEVAPDRAADNRQHRMMPRGAFAYPHLDVILDREGRQLLWLRAAHAALRVQGQPLAHCLLQALSPLHPKPMLDVIGPSSMAPCNDTHGLWWHERAKVRQGTWISACT